MLSGLGMRNLITAKAMGLIFSLFDITLSQDVPFYQPQYVQCMHHGLSFVLLSVPFVVADSPRCQFAVAQCMTGLISETILTLSFVCNAV